MCIKTSAICVLLLIVLSLNSCGLIEPYMVPVTQGKAIKDKIIFDLKPNMTKSEVIFILGSPDIIDTFNPNQFIYVNICMHDTNYDKLKLILTFNNKDKLVGIAGNYVPPTRDAVF